MKNTKTFNVVMLSTEKASKIQKFGNQLRTTQFLNGMVAYWQHIYIVSEEEIKVGDIIYDKVDFAIYELNNSSVVLSINESNSYNKVIASTDKELGLPLIHESFFSPFIKAYNEGNQITEIDLEINEFIFNPETEDEYKVTDKIYVEDCETHYKIITRKDGTVIIHQSKTYTKSEVEKIINNFADYVDNLYRAHTSDNMLAWDNKDQWIKDNL